MHTEMHMNLTFKLTVFQWVFQTHKVYYTFHNNVYYIIIIINLLLLLLFHNLCKYGQKCILKNVFYFHKND